MKSYILISDLKIKTPQGVGYIVIPEGTIINGEINNATKLLNFTYNGLAFSVDTQTQVAYFKLYSYAPTVTTVKYKLNNDLNIQPVGDKKISVFIPKETVVEATISTHDDVAPCQIPPCPFNKTDYLNFTYKTQQFKARKSYFTETTEAATQGSELSASVSNVKAFPFLKNIIIITVGIFAIYGLFSLAKKI